MGLGLSIFLEWFSAIVVGTLLGLAVCYIFDKNEGDGEDDKNEEIDGKE